MAAAPIPSGVQSRIAIFHRRPATLLYKDRVALRAYSALGAMLGVAALGLGAACPSAWASGGQAEGPDGHEAA